MTKKDGWGTFLTTTATWIVATFAAWLAAIFVAATLFAPGRSDVPDSLSAAISGIVGGLVLGAGQWVVLRRWVAVTDQARKGWGWVIASALGFGLGLGLVDILGGGSGIGARTGMVLVLIWAVGGALMGFVQALAGSYWRGSVWWVLSTALAWAALAFFARALADGNFVLGVLAQAVLSWVGVVLVLAKGNSVMRR